MKKNWYVVCIVSLVLFAACATPGWYNNPPASKNGIVYGVGQARMATERMSLDAAMNRARVDIAKKLDSTVIAETEAGASRTLTDVKLENTKVEKTFVHKNGTAYCLLSYSKIEVNLD